MAQISYVNGRYLPHRDAAVHVEDRGYQFADGVYEYMAFFNRTVLDGDAHLARLERSLKELSIPAPMAMTGLRVVMDELIGRNSRAHGGLYLQITRGVARRDHPFPKDTKPALVLTVCGPKIPKEHEVTDGVRVITTPDLRWWRRDIKSVSLLANVLAKQEASKRQAREAWLLDSGNDISEGSVSNAYIVSNEGELITHHADQNILSGVTRDVVLRLARKANIPVAERSFNIVEARQAREAFITSTSANVLPVVKIDEHVIGSGKPGEVTRRLHELYLTHIHKQTGWRP